MLVAIYVLDLGFIAGRIMAGIVSLAVLALIQNYKDLDGK